LACLSEELKSSNPVPNPAQTDPPVDGSLLADIPVAELGFLFHARRFVVAQCNLHAGARAAESTGLAASLLAALDADMRRRVVHLASLRSITPSWLRELLSQPYAAPEDFGVTVVATGLTYALAATQPSERDIEYLIDRGRRATWHVLRDIQAGTTYERTLSRIVERLAASTPAGSADHLTPLSADRIARTASWAGAPGTGPAGAPSAEDAGLALLTLSDSASSGSPCFDHSHDLDTPSAQSPPGAVLSPFLSAGAARTPVSSGASRAHTGGGVVRARPSAR